MSGALPEAWKDARLQVARAYDALAVTARERPQDLGWFRFVVIKLPDGLECTVRVARAREGAEFRAQVSEPVTVMSGPGMSGPVGAVVMATTPG